MWSKGLSEATSVPGDAVESQHISALPFTDEAALEQVCWVRVSGPRSRWLTTKALLIIECGLYKARSVRIGNASPDLNAFAGLNSLDNKHANMSWSTGRW